jgi:hypothetical protein
MEPSGLCAESDSASNQPHLLPGLEAWFPHRALPWSRPASVEVEGVRLDPATTYQRFCSVRQCYVALDRRDHHLVLESPHRVPQLPLVGLVA